MLMAWPDDRLKANFHRVRAKEVGKPPDRYSIAYFNTGRKSFVLQGPQKNPPITCGDYFHEHVKKQFGTVGSHLTRRSKKKRSSSGWFLQLLR
ncbi:hypothetical protein L207DRAFT_515875 [Hyaloscypha variabilis F]|uniref:Isopenicillin N synthase-like Fe(2+) 2OG dioxygenase domain-containing protein n=1 Tax=Hyaloscypha variabilis (strain UAMH 11265 / GT02V1 / F) TaxID=1149755 RepID=A0A2J6RCB4_HYAVF|nr:hypothetical protein L207DRAFT_515875 [Hyaloscypha variabilis F]